MTESNNNDENYSSTKIRPNSSRFPPISYHPKSAPTRRKVAPIYSHSQSFDKTSKENQRPKSSAGYEVFHNEIISLKRMSSSFPSLSTNASPTKIEERKSN
jgi:hypothetical protein